MIKQFTVLLLISITTLFPQKDRNNNYLDTIWNDAEIFFMDGYSFYSYPFRMNESQWISTAGIGIGTYFLIHNDDNLRNIFGKEVGRYNNNDFWKPFEIYGVVQFAELAGVATYAIGLFSKHNRTRVLGRMIVQSLTYSGLTSMGLRMIAGRKRPPFSDNPKEFTGFETDNSFQSFPSGHVTVAFALSTVLAEYFDTPLSRICFYGIAGLASAERLINSQHWFTDVALGALVGIAGGLHVVKSEVNRTAKSKSKMVITPSFGGINIQYRLN